MLHNRLRAVRLYIAYGDTMLLRRGEVDVVDPGCCQADESNSVGLIESILRQPNLVCEDDWCASNPVNDLSGCCIVKNFKTGQYLQQRRNIQLVGADRREIEEYCFHSDIVTATSGDPER